MIENVFSRKRVTALFVALAMVLSCLAGIVPVGVKAEAVSNKTVEEAVEWIQDRGRENWTNGANCQCVDLVKAYYDYLGIGRVLGNGYDYADSNNVLIDDMTRDTNPKPGDIIAWGANRSAGWSSDYNSDYIYGYGHVGLVYAVDGSTVYTVETNTTTKDKENDVIVEHHYARFLTRVPKNAVYIHPNFKGVELGTPMTSGAGPTIPNGDYHISCWDNNQTNYVMSVGGVYPGSNYIGDDGGLIQLYDAFNETQVFTVTFVGDGFYKIIHKHSGKSLDVKDGWNAGIGADLQLRTYDGNPAQLWSIERVDNGSGRYGIEGITYRIRSKCNGYYIDLPGGDIGNDKKLQLYKKEEPEKENEINEKAQNWRLIPYVDSTYKPLKSGPYRIQNYNTGKYLNADPVQNAAVTIGNNSNDKFFVRYTNDGCYRIESMTENYCIDVPKSSFVNGTKVEMFTQNSPATDNQKWIIKEYQNWVGWYYNIVSQCNGLFLDKSTSGAIVHYPNEADTQEWRFIRLSLPETVKCRYVGTSLTEIPTITYGQTLESAETELFEVKYYNYDTESYEIIPGKFVWKDKTIKPAVTDSKSTDFEILFEPDDKNKFGDVDLTLTQWVEIIPAEAPEGMPKNKITPDSSVKKVGDIDLPENWKWSESDSDTALEVGTPVTATAVYTGSDGGAGNYKKESVAITITVTGQDCSHPQNKQEVRSKIEPDCTNDGYTGDIYCTECNTVIEKGSTISAVGHKNIKTEASEATCENRGNIEYWTCETCEKIFSDAGGTTEITLSEVIIPAKEHDWCAWKITKNPTETVTGSAERICTHNAAHKDAVSVPVLTDTSVWTKISSEEPTEDNAGSRTYTSVYGEVTVELPALGHTTHTYSGEWLFDGTSHWKKCDKCSETTVPENHAGGTATCSQKAICTTCSQEYGNLAAHTEVIDPAVPVSCTVSGLSAGKHCSVCNEILVPQTVIPAAGHKEDSGTVTKRPTTSEPGERTFKCIICGDVIRIEAIPVISEDHVHNYGGNWKYDGVNHWYECECGEINDINPHNIVIDEAVSADCTTPGKTEGKRCSVCNLVFIEQIDIPALGHTIVTDEAVPASCTTSGKTAGTHCSVCGEIITVATIIPASGHIGGTATCSHKAICSICGQEYGDLMPHKSDGGTVTKEPTATETGTRTFKCTVCGTVISTETIPSTGSNVDTPSYPSQPSYPTTPPAQTVPSPANNEPYIKGDNSQKGWAIISDRILNTPDGGTVTVTMNGTTEIPQNIISEIAGKDIDLVVEIDDLIWTINGKDVTKAKKVDMGIKKNTNKIPKSIIDEFFGNAKTVTLSLAHNGDFGFTATLTIELGTENNGFSANLFCYKPSSGSFEYGDSSEIINGKANLTFSHASEWLISVNEFPAYEDVSTAAGVMADETSIPIDNKCNAALAVIPIAVLSTGTFIYRRKARK